MQRVEFNGDKIGLIVRGKWGHPDRPSVMRQHADCILSTGEPVGFFGEEPGATGHQTGSGSWVSAGMNMSGKVYRYADLKRKRPVYANASQARTWGMVSTLLVLAVSKTEAMLFDAFWARLSDAPGAFNFVGGNCSTHASQAFQYAGMLGGGVPGLDTPDNLYRQLCATRHTKWVYAGCVGAEPKGNGRFDVVIDF